MDFKAFQNSNFFKVGCARFDYKNQSYFPNWGFCLYDAIEQIPLSSKNKEYLDYQTPNHSYITLLPLQRALQLKPFSRNINEAPFIPLEFKKEITNQYIEVSDLLKRMLEENPNINLLHSMLLISAPGNPIPMHIHQCKQSITFCYKFDDGSIASDSPSVFEFGFGRNHRTTFPNEYKSVFMLRNDPPHEVRSNEWRFFWFNDFSDTFDMPKNIPFVYWDYEFFDGSKLDPSEHVPANR